MVKESRGDQPAKRRLKLGSRRLKRAGEIRAVGSLIASVAVSGAIAVSGIEQRAFGSKGQDIHMAAAGAMGGTVAGIVARGLGAVRGVLFLMNTRCGLVVSFDMLDMAVVTRVKGVREGGGDKHRREDREKNDPKDASEHASI